MPRRARAIVQGHCALWASRPQLKRDPLGGWLTLLTGLRVVGWLLLLGSVAAWAVYVILDRRLRAFRRLDVPWWRYHIIPFNLQEHLYQSEGAPLVGRIWRALGFMFAFGIAGALLLAIAL